MIRLEPAPENLAQAARFLRQGGVVAHPTDTVYGLAVDPFSEAALDALFRAKGRDDGKPVLLIVATLEQVRQVALPMNPQTLACARTFWPGPLSLLLPAVADLPSRITGPSRKVCVRCPACATARALCNAFGGPLTSSSANPSGLPPATRLEEIDMDGVGLGINGGTLHSGVPSTIFDPETGQVVRSGAIPVVALAPFVTGSS